MTSNLNRALEWTSPQIQPLLLGALCFIGLTLFSMALWPKLKLLWSARSAERCDRIFERIVLTLKIAFGQSKLLQEKGAGWMHALIFWGFLILLFRAAEFFLIGFFPETDFSFPASNALFVAYAWVKDAAVFLVGLAVFFALYRRLVLKPQRLTLSREGLLILLLILAIMVSDVLFDSAFLALHSEGHSGPIGMILAPAFEMLGKNILGNLHSLAYWLHTSSILFFLILLPRSKHFHILTSIPNVFFSSLGNNLNRIDFEEEESFGVINSKDFNWKQMLDLHTCTQCGRCDRACPAWATGKPLSPQQLTVDLRDHLNGPLDSDIPLLGGIIEDETIWSCTTCGACEASCPVMIGYVDKVIDLRRGLVLTEDRYPKEFNNAFKSLETQSNPWGFPKASRSDWAKELGIPIWDKTKPTEYLYFVGCNGSFDSRGKKISEAVVQTLKEAGVEFSILGNDEGCTGDPARRAGNEYLFDMLASANAETFKEQGVRKVVTHCPHCLNSLKNEYPEFGTTLEVIHHSELLQKLIEEGKIVPQQNAEENVVFHDSCYLGRHNEIYEAPREVLNASTKPDSVKEVEQSRETGTCCGAGGARFLLEENTGTRMSHHRLDELMVTNPDTIAVSCPFCVLMLEDAIKAKNLKVQVKDIGELLVKKS
ncbi:MAG TPA: (Fe-S)-binding protein [Nitrospinae bacterium]|jgi:Fe-S oxidoreductase/nitrate reductase gamma subunit|nr:(Fe-S)-binding protein [Nitrospinota bacterium]